jgi:hypothetical protein
MTDISPSLRGNMIALTLRRRDQGEARRDYTPARCTHVVIRASLDPSHSS